MRKSVILPGVAVVGGLVGLAVRWLYLTRGFAPGTGLPVSGSPTPWLMVLGVAAVVVIPLALSRGKHQVFDRCYTGAFASHSLPCVAGMLAGAVLFAVGGFLALALWVSSPMDPITNQRSMSAAWLVTGVLCLLGAAGIYFVTQKMRQGKPILTAWVVTPGFACALWVMANSHQNWAEEPILGHYWVPMLAAALSLVACFLVAGFAFDKGRVPVTQTVCVAAAALDIMALADGLSLADTALYLAMMFYLASMASSLAANDAKGAQQPLCATFCQSCAGCAPMGTMPPKEKKKKKGETGDNTPDAPVNP